MDWDRKIRILGHVKGRLRPAPEQTAGPEIPLNPFLERRIAREPLNLVASMLQETDRRSRRPWESSEHEGPGIVTVSLTERAEGADVSAGRQRQFSLTAEYPLEGEHGNGATLLVCVRGVRSYRPKETPGWIRDKVLALELVPAELWVRSKGEEWPLGTIGGEATEESVQDGRFGFAECDDIGSAIMFIRQAAGLQGLSLTPEPGDVQPE